VGGERGGTAALGSRVMCSQVALPSVALMRK